MKPETENYIREAVDVMRHRWWQAHNAATFRLDQERFGYRTGSDEARAWRAGDVALQIRATSLRLDSLAMKGAGQ